jgi:hypothetical protein
MRHSPSGACVWRGIHERKRPAGRSRHSPGPHRVSAVHLAENRRCGGCRDTCVARRVNDGRRTGRRWAPAGVRRAAVDDDPGSGQRRGLTRDVCRGTNDRWGRRPGHRSPSALGGARSAVALPLVVNGRVRAVDDPDPGRGYRRTAPAAACRRLRSSSPCGVRAMHGVTTLRGVRSFCRISGVRRARGDKPRWPIAVCHLMHVSRSFRGPRRGRVGGGGRRRMGRSAPSITDGRARPGGGGTVGARRRGT